jgi:hydrogenase nickel incorporation protein HypB
MCETCGCGQTDPAIIRKPGEHYKYNPTHHHHDGADHEHTHDHDHGLGRELSLELNIMRKNDMLAERNRGYFEAKKIFALNMVSSPGSGKTSILERTIKESAGMVGMYIIEGDQQTMLDADRIEKAGAPVVQVNTGNGCHLDAEMINQAVKKLDVADGSILMIENVGNLVCPALFDLGESKRVVIISVTEGEDKPLKYPNMFQSAQLCLINKSDLLPYVDFNLDKVKEYALRVNHHLDFLTISAKTGEGFGEWLEWLKKAVNM